MKRRRFLQISGLSALSAFASSQSSPCLPCFPQVHAQGVRPRKILLRSSWQMVNIGDIAHTPGVLAILERFFPDAEVTLWASGEYSEEVHKMESRRFPFLKKVVKGRVSPDGMRVSDPELGRALEECDFILHGSGASFVAHRDIASAVLRTGKPYGIWGITWSGGDEAQLRLMDQAKFIFFRDSVSLETAKAAGVHAPVMEFGPDGAFACDLRNDAAAEAFLADHGLETGKFACVIPRYRVTPYWKIRSRPMTEKDRENWALSQSMKEHDNGPIRRAVIETVRQTGLKVLICPEDKSQVELGREMLYEPLPDDVKQRVVWRDRYWITDEAISTYVRSAGLFGLEMHSPIMCVGNGVPAIVCRFRQQTSKGFMWRDIGLGDWLFNMDEEAEIPGIMPAVLEMLTRREESLAKVAKAQEFVRARQTRMAKVLADVLSSLG
ncbi:MAG: polysaccharide pyruvyl transferase family protein [Planctomycetaceae bacterium]|nr:polysaccharide pyruvyl transferase family protein [Planctomycetaceae bacterium]